MRKLRHISSRVLSPPYRRESFESVNVSQFDDFHIPPQFYHTSSYVHMQIIMQNHQNVH